MHIRHFFQSYIQFSPFIKVLKYNGYYKTYNGENWDYSVFCLIDITTCKGRKITVEQEVKCCGQIIELLKMSGKKQEYKRRTVDSDLHCI